MKKITPNFYATENALAYILSSDSKKLEQVEKVADINWNLTTSDEVHVLVEMMEQHIVRYTITGTRSEVRFCWSVDEQKIIRQPRGLQRHPLFDEINFDQYVWGLIDEAKKRMADRELAEEVA